MKKLILNKINIFLKNIICSLESYLNSNVNIKKLAYLRVRLWLFFNLNYNCGCGYGLPRKTSKICSSSEFYLYEGAKKIKNQSPIVQTFYGRQSVRLFIIKNWSIRAQLAYVITHAFKWTEICPGDYDFFTTVHAEERKEEKILRSCFCGHLQVWSNLIKN